jgi:hypothetical protein
VGRGKIEQRFHHYNYPCKHVVPHDPRADTTHGLEAFVVVDGIDASIAETIEYTLIQLMGLNDRQKIFKLICCFQNFPRC